MPYEHTNSMGQKYFLNSIVAKNGRPLYFFGKDKRSPAELPQGYSVTDNPLTALPLLKKGK